MRSAFRRAITCLSILVTIPTTAFSGYDYLFSSLLISKLSQRFVLMDDIVMVQTKNDITLSATTRRMRNDNIDANEQNPNDPNANCRDPHCNVVQQDHHLNGGSYEYTVPRDGCYVLLNKFSFCVKDGKIEKVLKEPDRSLLMEDAFFYNSNRACNIWKFEVLYHLFVMRKNIKYEEYQLKIDNFPEFVKVILWKDYNNKLVEKDELKSMKVFFLSEHKDVGCLPYNKLTLYTSSEAQLYPFHVNKYPLVGPFNPINMSKKELFLEVDGSNVKYYNRDLLLKKYPAFR